MGDSILRELDKLPDQRTRTKSYFFQNKSVEERRHEAGVDVLRHAVIAVDARIRKFDLEVCVRTS